jgi:crossover junction endodeoxyribonuclease RuvC
MMIILGIDPGLRNTGFGVIQKLDKTHNVYCGSGVIQTDAKLDLTSRISTIVHGLLEIIEQYQPNQVSIEKVFVNLNPQATLLLGQARGACLAACALAKLNVAEYTALQIKQAVVGYGHADKEQVISMVMRELNLTGRPQLDAGDGLACALAHQYYSRMEQILPINSVKQGRIRSQKF